MSTRTTEDAETVARAASTSGTAMTTGEDLGAIETIRRGAAPLARAHRGHPGHPRSSPSLASAGQVVVPIAVQQTLDRGLDGPGGPDVSFTVLMGLVAAAADRAHQRAPLRA